ncbi:hypothetical protein U1Q18_035001 [Sarracenia purpurea var. burkii]
MEVQEQNQTISQVQRVKQEAPEEEQKTSKYDNEEDSPPVPKLLISTQNPHDLSPKIGLWKRPYAPKEGTVPIKRKRSGSRFETNRVRAHLPSEFCKFHLPRGDETIVLEDESGKKFTTNFLADKGLLSGGWRGFSIAQNLLEGDVVVFHLVGPCKFKVYIVRPNDLDVADALDILHSDGCEKETDFGAYMQKNSGTCKNVLPNILQENVGDIHTMAKQICPGPVTGQSEHDGKNLPSSSIEGFKLSRPISDFKNFTIVVNGLTIDSELSKHIREKYYDLCCTRKSYLHDGLLNTINSTMAAGIISETANLADAIRACKISTSLDDFATLEKTLEALEMLGMDVGFLRARLSWLVGLALELTEAHGWKRYEEARVERDRIEEEIGLLERKILELKQGRSRLSDEMEALMENVQRYMVIFKEEANAPW